MSFVFQKGHFYQHRLTNRVFHWRDLKTSVDCTVADASGVAMLKNISIMFSFLLLISTTVEAASISALKAIVDEFNYAVTVEWDQQDKKFYEMEVQKFKQALRELENNGLTREEMAEFLVIEMNDERLAQEIRSSMALVDNNKLEAELAHRQLIENIKQTYEQGASWRGEYTITIIGGALLVVSLAIFGIVMAVSSNDTSTEKDRAFGNETSPPFFPTDTSSPKPY